MKTLLIAVVFVLACASAATLEERIAALENRLDTVILTPGSKGDRGPRGDRGYAGERGERGLCVALDPEAGDEIEFNCPDAADSETVKFLQTVVLTLARDLIIRQIDQEQMWRMSGGSGITITRGYHGGYQPYHEASFANFGILNIHDHADHEVTVGLGEFAAVLNGVHFVTRHNDYAMRKSSSSDTAFLATERLPMPDVPPEVLGKPTVAEQVTEMQAWFKAFKDQDYSVRDYRPYFKPVLAYLEGFWVEATEALTDPFFSDRHQIDAASWEALYQKITLLYSSGRKNNLENLPYLPSCIRGLGGENGTIPIVANWNYRILVHPVSFDIPLNRFRVEDDFHIRLWRNPVSLGELEDTRRARFALNPRDQDTFFEGPSYGPEFIDTIMQEIPGLNNHGAELYDRAFAETSTYYGSGDELNVGYYSRYYSTATNDAMGRSNRRRSFQDGTMWSAMTTQSEVSGLRVDDEMGPLVDDACNPDTQRCERYPNIVEQKWSYAIPLEFIYTTPLTNWNPYNIPHRDTYNAAAAGGRNGGLTPETAYDGTSPNIFYRTPKEFFEGGSEDDPADTAEGVVGVLDSTGTVRECAPSGHWVHFPNIGGGVGKLRQRYPVAPIHEHTTTTYKELQALKQLIKSSDISSLDSTFGVDFELTLANGHTHALHLDNSHVATLQGGGTVVVASSESGGHSHDVTISYDSAGKVYVMDNLGAPVEAHNLERVVV